MLVSAHRALKEGCGVVGERLSDEVQDDLGLEFALERRIGIEVGAAIARGASRGWNWRMKSRLVR